MTITFWEQRTHSTCLSAKRTGEQDGSVELSLGGAAPIIIILVLFLLRALTQHLSVCRVVRILVIQVSHMGSNQDEPKVNGIADFTFENKNKIKK